MSPTTQRRTKQRGFTIVELLVVIVIIAVLAAITIVAYNGITQRATATALQSDLTNAYKQLQAAYIVNGTFPADTSSFKTSSGNAFQYTVDNASNPPTFCLTATNPINSTGYNVTDQNSAPNVGLCTGHVQNPSSGTAPVITLQPTAVVRNFGIDSMTSMALFSPTTTVAASGTPAPTCQWQLAYSSTGPWSNSGASDATSTTFRSYGWLDYSDVWFRAVFTNTAGSATTNSFKVNAALEP